jgi:crotonobetainyl-CoA:carnitine CoA-transferase CaiB-like acyl-CoA transferase
MSQRIENREELIPLLQSKFLQKTTTDWLSKLRENGVPAGPVNDIAEVLSNGHAIERNLVRHIDNGANESVPHVSNPVDFGRTPVCYAKAPPLLGEHTKEVLREWLGYSDDKIESLTKSEVI